MGRRRFGTKWEHKADGIAADARLIRACVAYAQARAAWKAGYAADPDPEGCMAGAMGVRHRRRMGRALERIVLTPAVTPLGLDAKARVVALMAADTWGGLSTHEVALMSGFAEEVRAMLGRGPQAADAQTADGGMAGDPVAGWR